MGLLEPESALEGVVSASTSEGAFHLGGSKRMLIYVNVLEVIDYDNTGLGRDRRNHWRYRVIFHSSLSSESYLLPATISQRK